MLPFYFARKGKCVSIKVADGGVYLGPCAFDWTLSKFSRKNNLEFEFAVNFSAPWTISSFYLDTLQVSVCGDYFRTEL